MKISSNFSAYIWLTCLTIFVAVAFHLNVTDEEIFNFIHAIFGLREVPTDVQIKTSDFMQRLDHFNRTEYHRKFKQNYFYIDKYYDSAVTEPVVLLVVIAMTQLDDDPMYLNSEINIEFAKHSKALILFLEPRFYGTSQPFEDLSDDNLEYLNNEQTLADIALFKEQIPVKFRKEHSITIPTNAKWVVTGREFGGTLAAWFRLKYPHHAVAAVSLGAPMWTKPSFDEYFDKVERYFFKHEVLDTITHVLGSISSTIHSTRSWRLKKVGLDTLFKDFKMCEPLYTETTKEGGEPYGTIIQPNVDLMFFSLVYQLSIPAQGLRIKKNPIDILKDLSLDRYDRVSHAIKYLISHNRNDCLETNYQKYVDLYKNTELKNTQDSTFLPEILKNVFGRRTSFYQKCFEFGRFETTSEENAFYPYVTIYFYKKFCTQVYKPELDTEVLEAAIYATNIVYGSTNYAGRKTLFISRVQDPIISIEVKESKKENEMVAIIMTTVPQTFDNATEEQKKSLEKYYYRIFKPFLKWTGKYNEETESDAEREENKIDIYQDYPDQKQDYFSILQNQYRKDRQKHQDKIRKAEEEAAIKAEADAAKKAEEDAAKKPEEDKAKKPEEDKAKNPEEDAAKKEEEAEEDKAKKEEEAVKSQQ